MSWSEAHGAITHFPVALLTVSIAFEAGAIALRKREWSRVGFWLLAVAAVAALPAALTGYLAARSLFPGAWPLIAKLHVTLAASTAAVAWIALILRIRRSDNRPGRAGIVLGLLAAALVGGAGYLGGRMVFGDETVEEPSAAAASTPPSVPAQPVSLGERLFRSSANGCMRCHKLDGKGGPTGPDLTHEGRRQVDIEWHIRHLKDPDKVRPGSPMPSYNHLTHEELTALARFLAGRK